MAIPKSLENALDMLPHLALCAIEKRTITYGELGELIGVPAFFMGQSLDYLRDQILPNHKLPRLDALVVNKESKEAGESFYAGGAEGIDKSDFHDLLEWERQKVYEYERWAEVIPRLRVHYGGEEYARSRQIVLP